MAVDVGHTHVRVAVGDATGAVVEERFTELPQGIAPLDVLAAAADLVADVTAAQELGARGVVGVTLGLPAPVDKLGRPAVARVLVADAGRVIGRTLAEVVNVLNPSGRFM